VSYPDPYHQQPHGYQQPDGYQQPYGYQQPPNPYYPQPIAPPPADAKGDGNSPGWQLLNAVLTLFTRSNYGLGRNSRDRALMSLLIFGMTIVGMAVLILAVLFLQR
jgi:hypothetical protein